MKSLNTAHLLPLALPLFTAPSSLAMASAAAGRAAICAMFLLNLSFSLWINASFFFIAPGLLFKLLCLIFISPIAVAPLALSVVSGNASAKDSRVVTSFLDGRLRFLDGALDFSMREMRAECLIIRLSFFVVVNNPSFLRCVEKLLDGVELGFRVVEGRLVVMGACFRYDEPFKSVRWLDHLPSVFGYCIFWWEVSTRELQKRCAVP